MRKKQGWRTVSRRFKDCNEGVTLLEAIMVVAVMGIIMTSMVSFWSQRARDAKMDGIASRTALEMAQFARAAREFANVGFIDAGNAEQMKNKKAVGKTKIGPKELINQGLLPKNFAGDKHQNFFGQDYIAIVDFTRGARTGSVVVTTTGDMDEEKLKFAVMQNNDDASMIVYRIAKILAVRYPVAGVGVGVIPSRSVNIEGLYGAFTMNAQSYVNREKDPRPALIAGFQ